MMVESGFGWRYDLSSRLPLPSSPPTVALPRVPRGFVGLFPCCGSSAAPHVHGVD